MHAEQRNMLAQRLAQDFAQRLTFKNAPGFVLAFLRGPWAQVVAESQLRCTDGREDADGYLTLVDDLIWSVQPRLVRKNRERLVELVPQLLVQIRQGLAHIDFPEERITPFFDALITVHEQAFDNAKFVAQRDAPVSPPPDATGDFWMADAEAQDSGFVFEAATSSPPPDAPEVADPALQSAWSAESLHTGAWVDIALGGVWVRAQLSWCSPHRTLFMFTSGGGLAHSMSRRTMDRLRGLGLIHLVSDGRVMDNALDAVAREALRNDVKNASGDRVDG